MAQSKPRTNRLRTKPTTQTEEATKPKSGWSMPSFRLKWDRVRWAFILGMLCLLAGTFLLIAFISHLVHGPQDQSLLQAGGNIPTAELAAQSENVNGYWGAHLAAFFMQHWIGIGALLLPPFLLLTGLRLAFKFQLYPIGRYFLFMVFTGLWLSLALGYLAAQFTGWVGLSFYSGFFGFALATDLLQLIGFGTPLLLLGSAGLFIGLFYGLIGRVSTKAAAAAEGGFEDSVEDQADTLARAPKDTEETAAKHPFFQEEDLESLEEEEDVLDSGEEPVKDDGKQWKVETKSKAAPTPKEPREEGPRFHVEVPEEEQSAEEGKAPEGRFSVHKPQEEKTADEVENLDPYDPTLDLPHYQYPVLDLLNEYDFQRVTVSKQELEDNKNKIVETLVNFKIGIQEIKATIGPTVTLYEIIPDPGVKISKIKNLEDDIALSLAALGIRIIAPIPGRGTIGIEVPNKNRELVPARSVFGTEKFMRSDKDLPVALGKTISNEVFVVDLAKMPHLLMAGATGQGKSVGLNMILASLVYKKHPAQLKFVLVDPKKVELTLFNKIERHFLAKLPGTEEAIITDTKKVIYTLNSLCIEMDNRYDLLKDAGCRNLKEYNAKFISRKLNPEKGHRYMPYIVLVIDELADLMMTAGKEIEGPIARLAQLARAIGIHLVVATQRPSVNVITGIIKANFPARLSFRVTSKIDSRTILDAGGAEQLIGMGDMLLNQGSEVTRLQCAFLDTPEVEAVCDWIGEQKGYPDAYMLPEFEGEEGEGSANDIDLSERDALFDEAARLIVLHQQGSTSLIQRKLKLGYNRAGRIVDQLEAAGIVGPFEGSKAREVLIQDEASLERLLSSL
ncbi:MAG: DNA translocase FtsK [Nitritalea sp.]